MEKIEIKVCRGKNCSSRFSEYILKRLELEKEKFKLDEVDISIMPCQNQCEKGPNVSFDGKIENYQDPIKSSKLMHEKVKILREKFKKNLRP
ncbi:(2Fe-2S) ferredoxin domain-containing protein [Candidatus Gracilibacteria bacterium]|nr:(2Fe-2S) ferredoxin domain-containing protein [Candidatus Gracilibacteria bacterium]